MSQPSSFPVLLNVCLCLTQFVILVFLLKCSVVKNTVLQGTEVPCSYIVNGIGDPCPWLTTEAEKGNSPKKKQSKIMYY